MGRLKGPYNTFGNNPSRNVTDQNMKPKKEEARRMNRGDVNLPDNL